MRPAHQSGTHPTRAHTPRAFPVFAAAFVAGAAAAVAVNSVLDVRLAQSKPQVESEPIFVALRSLPQGAPVTVWDVALREWPRAMVPTSALRASDAFSGLVLRHPLREGQPLLSIQLVDAEPRPVSPPSSPSVTAVSTPAAPTARTPDADLWAPAEPSRPDAVTAMPAPGQPAPEHQPGASTPQPIPVAQQAAAPQPQADMPTTRGSDQAAPPPGPPVAASIPAADTAASPAAPDRAAAEPSVAATAPAADPGASQPRPLAATPDVVVATIMPFAAADDESGTDERMEALAAAAPPAADSLVVPPSADVIAPRGSGTASDVPVGSVENSITVAADGEGLADTSAPASVTPDDGVAPQSAPTPTLADPPSTTVADESSQGEAATPASVMRQPTPGDFAPAPAPVPAQPRVATRYLVVPESIALQADASFAGPRQPASQPTPLPPQAAADTVTPLPSTTAVPGRPQAASQPQQQRASQPRRSTSAAIPGQRPTTPQATAQQPRRGMFPNIAAGIESLESEVDRMRRDRAGQATPTTTPRPRPQY